MRFRKLFAAVTTSAIAAAIFAAPTAAAPGDARVFVAHGIPGAVVDVCVNGAEVKSGFRYGQQFRADLPAGSYAIRVRLADHGTCGGAVVIRQDVDLTAGLNATAVANIVAGKPALSIFVNDRGLAGAGNTSVTVRHTAVAPTVDVWVNGGTAAITGLGRGDEVGPVELPGGVYSFWASAAGGYRPVIGPAVRDLDAGKAYQILAVGTKVSNYRFIVIQQAGAPV